MTFDELKLAPDLLRGIDDLGFTEPTPIQADAIPPGMEGRDLLGAAMTGSGKTAAFLLPILHQLLPRSRGVTRALALTPTRELAAQIEEHLQALGKHTPLTAAVIHGGVAFEPQEKAFRDGVDMMIATPGRLLDHLRRPYGHLDGVEFLVLDEADRMLDMGFIPDIRRILKKLPGRRQTMLFSATMPGPIASLAKELLEDPVTINIERKAAPADGITQVTYAVRHAHKPALLLHLLNHGGIENALAFTRTKERADRLAGYLKGHGISVTAIHGDRSQMQRTRALEAFKKGKYRVLVATDVAARGIDVEGLSHVVNVDVPSQPEDYIHRIGRTGRQQATGDAITFVAARELADLHAIERAIRSKLPRLTAEGFDYDTGRSIPTPEEEAAERERQEAEKARREAERAAREKAAVERAAKAEEAAAAKKAAAEKAAAENAAQRQTELEAVEEQIRATAAEAKAAPATGEEAAAAASPADESPAEASPARSQQKPEVPAEKAVRKPRPAVDSDRQAVVQRFREMQARRRGGGAPANPEPSSTPQDGGGSPSSSESKGPAAAPKTAPQKTEAAPPAPRKVAAEATPAPTQKSQAPQSGASQPGAPQPAKPQRSSGPRTSKPAEARRPAARPRSSALSPERAAIVERFRAMRNRQRG